MIIKCSAEHGWRLLAPLEFRDFRVLLHSLSPQTVPLLEGLTFEGDTHAWLAPETVAALAGAAADNAWRESFAKMRDYARGRGWINESGAIRAHVEIVPWEKDDPLLVERREGYVILTLNRPDKLNAMNAELLQRLLTAFDSINQDSRCRAVLLTGAGRGFCTGQDLSEREFRDGRAPDLARSLREGYNPVVRAIRECPAPVVAAVNGAAAGAGASIAFACDIVVAARSARFIQSFSKIGLVPDAGGTWTVPRLIGDARARAWAMLADSVDAETAERWGLIWLAIDDSEHLTQAHGICAELATRSRSNLASLKQAFNASPQNSLAAQLDLEAKLQGEAGGTERYRDAVSAFNARRKPAP